MLTTHGHHKLTRSERSLETDYTPGDVGPGTLRMRIDDARTLESREIAIRLDPWIADEYRTFEWTSSLLLVFGAHAAVVVDLEDVAVRSSVAFVEDEVETRDAPWCVALEAPRCLIVATTRRIWCVDEGGATRWVWRCPEGDGWWSIHDAPERHGAGLVVPLHGPRGDSSCAVGLADGLSVVGEPCPR